MELWTGCKNIVEDGGNGVEKGRGCVTGVSLFALYNIIDFSMQNREVAGNRNCKNSRKRIGKNCYGTFE